MQTSLVEMQMVAPVLYDLNRGEIGKILFVSLPTTYFIYSVPEP